MECFHFFEHKMDAIESAKNIYLPSHHLKKHDKSSRMKSISSNEFENLIKHFLIIIKTIFASDKGCSWLPFFYIIRNVFIKSIFWNIGKISYQYCISLREIMSSIKKKGEKVRTNKKNICIFLFHQIMIIFLSNIKCILKMIS